ncbi:hypothetical protein ACWD3I_36845 [Streptomyces sp. NPDC002817]|uniref:hypothetical protein n=1 Tax=Streptomyces sp. NPDC088357 TaxID=3154655 RepID=UPI00342CA32C
MVPDLLQHTAAGGVRAAQDPRPGHGPRRRGRLLGRPFQTAGSWYFGDGDDQKAAGRGAAREQACATVALLSVAAGVVCSAAGVRKDPYGGEFDETARSRTVRGTGRPLSR